MAKQSGLGWTTLQVADAAGNTVDIRPGTGNMDFATPRAVQDITSVDLSAMERLLLLADFTITLNMQFDDASSTGQHWVFRTVNKGNNRAVTLVVGGSTLAASGVLFSDYTVTRGNDGKLTSKATGSLANGIVPTWA